MSWGLTLRLSEDIQGTVSSIWASISLLCTVREEKSEDYRKVVVLKRPSHCFFCYSHVYFHPLLFLFISTPPHPTTPPFLCFCTATSTKFCPIGSIHLLLICTLVFLVASSLLHSLLHHGCTVNCYWIWTCQKQFCTIFSSKNTCQNHAKWYTVLS